MGAAARQNGSAPNSWSYIAMGFITLIAAGVLATLLLIRYLNDRPVDLTPATRDLTIRLRNDLEANHIPPENIVIADGILQESDAAVWRHYDISVDVPQTLNLDGLAQVVKKNFTGRGVIVTGLSNAGRLEQLRLSLGGHVFATMTMNGGFTAITTVAERDVTPSCESLASDVMRLLRLRLPETAQLTRERPIHQEQGGVRWMTTPIVVRGEEFEGPTVLRDVLAERLADEDVSVTVHQDGDETATVVSYLGYDAVRITTGPIEEELPDVQLPQMPATEPPTPSEPNIGEELPDLDGPNEPPAPNGTAALLLESSQDTLLAATFPLDSEGLDESVFAPLPLDGPVEPITDPKVAIIVDDGGNNAKVDAAFLELDPGLTFAILPYTPDNARLAREGAARGFEIMLHMPMESGSATVTHTGMINTSMSAGDIAAYTKAAIEQIPGLEGVNNHTGSKFTEYEAGMKEVMNILKDKNLYFIDSRTSADSVAPEMAEAAGVPYAVRDVFLDNEADLEYIGRQFNELIAKARQRGFAIGICHFRPVTLQALKDLLPRLESEGVELVHASEFVQ